MSLARQAGAEFIGTAALLIAVVGSGIMGERLAGGNAAIALLANSLATGFALFVLIVVFAPLSGAHFNTWVSLRAGVRGEASARMTLAYLVAQGLGAITGVFAAHAMFGLALVQSGTHRRSEPGLWLGEAIATAGLILAIELGRTRTLETRAALVACWITGAYWFTSSTSFANAAVTLARAMTDTFSGIQPADVAGFIAAQGAGALAGHALAAWLEPASRNAR